MLKIAAAAALAVVVAAVLLALTHRARSEGRLTHCRNNLRQIGVLSHLNFAQMWEQLVLGPDPPHPPPLGRKLLQWVREAKYKDAQDRWKIHSALNPFGCPVRGVQPADFTTLSNEEYATLMSDPKTIDYLGPDSIPAERPNEPLVWAADRKGNHPEGGYVLLVDFSQQKVDKALEVTGGWERAKSLRQDD